jgi:hypothetical protein
MSNVHTLPVPAQGPPTGHLTRDQVAMYDRWLELVFQGVSGVRALRMIGVADHNLAQYLEEFTVDPYVVYRKHQHMSAFPTATFWTRGHSVLTLATIANNEFSAAKDRIAAVRELNLLLGFTKEEDPDANKRTKDPLTYLRSILNQPAAPK